MTLFTDTAITSLEQREAFKHVADLSNIHLWDPGVVGSAKVTPQPLGVGTIYALSVEYGGRALSMRYVVTEYQPSRRIVLEGTGGLVKAIDTISFAPHGEGTEVTYEADLRLTGLARLAQPFMRSRFDAIVKAGGNGLRAWLKELEQER